MARPFRFKRFTVSQERAAMKVGTDGVLLGAWCTVGPGMVRALDIGTGTGLIALMLAQRGELYGLQTDAIELEEGAFEDARLNISESPWSESVKVFNTPLQEFSSCHQPSAYDLIACNPPYFTSSLLPPDGQRTSARHDVDLDRETLITCAARLSESGTLFALIIPTEQAGEYITSCDLKGFSLRRRTEVFTTPSAPAKRTLLEFRYGTSSCPSSPPLYDKLVIETAPLDYTEEYKALTRDFYLKF